MASIASSASRPSHNPSGTWSASTRIFIARDDPRALGACLLHLPPLLLALLLALLLFLALLLPCQVVADDTAGCRAQHRVMVRDMPRHGAYGGTLEAALCLDGVRCGEQQKRGQRRRNPLFRFGRDHLKIPVSQHTRGRITPEHRKGYTAPRPATVAGARGLPESDNPGADPRGSAARAP